MSSSRKKQGAGKSKKYWSADVMKHSNALDLDHDVFKSTSSRKIDTSLKHSAEQSSRRKGTPYQSAMSTLNVYINRPGKNLSNDRKRVLELPKAELLKMIGRE